jgi:hypothetical protein
LKDLTMFRTSRKTILVAVVAALASMLAITSVGIAANDDASVAKKKKYALTKAQKKTVNKLIDAKIKKIQIPVVPAGPAAYTAKNDAQVNIPSDLSTVNPVLSKAIPAGKYVVSGHVNGFYLTNETDDEANLICRAKLNGTTVQTGQASNDAGIFLFLATGATLNIPFSFTVDAAAASTLSIDCSGGYDDPGTLQGEYVSTGQAVLNAVTVSSIG